jgi:hypothetical protein
MKKNKTEELKQIIIKANGAKDRLYEMVCELKEAGYNQKAKSLMTLIYKIEEWQNK